MRRVVLLLSAGLFAFFGLWGLISPEGMVSFVGLQASGPDGVADIRAMYGGAELAWAGILGWHAADEERVPRGLIFAGIAVGALGASRVLSMLLTGFTGLSVGFAISEIGAAAICLWFGWQE